MKNKFNWNRFYDELDGADPKKFPYYMWAVHELGSIITHVITGILLAFFLLIVIGTTLRVLAHDYPDLTFKTFQSGFCTDAQTQTICQQN
jgi:hypothetical protein